MAVEVPEWVVDAADIAAGQCLLRRVPDHALIGPDPDSSNFREKEEGAGLSVTLWQGQQDWDDILRFAPAGTGLTTLVVSDVRSLGLIVARAPLVGNLNHCEIWGIGSKTPKKLKKLHRWALYNHVVPMDVRTKTVDFKEFWEPRF